MEHRQSRVSDMRAQLGDLAEGKIEGYAAVFGELSKDLGGFREVIRPGAFAKTIQTADVRALWNHNTRHPLGRTKAGTLDLAEDQIGLKVVITPPDTQYARDLLVSMQRGDVTQMSFGFDAIRDEWTEAPAGGIPIRTLLEVRLYDVSPVTFPAYPQTSALVRKGPAAWLQGQAPAVWRLDLMYRRLRLAEVAI